MHFAGPGEPGLGICKASRLRIRSTGAGLGVSLHGRLGRRDAALEETVASEVLQKASASSTTFKGLFEKPLMGLQVESFSPQHLSIIVYSFAGDLQLLDASS